MDPPEPVRRNTVTRSSVIVVSSVPVRFVTSMEMAVGRSLIPPSIGFIWKAFSSAASQSEIRTPLAPKKIPPAKVPNGLCFFGENTSAATSGVTVPALSLSVTKPVLVNVPLVFRRSITLSAESYAWIIPVAPEPAWVTSPPSAITPPTAPDHSR